MPLFFNLADVRAGRRGASTVCFGVVAVLAKRVDMLRAVLVRDIIASIQANVSEPQRRAMVKMRLPPGSWVNGASAITTAEKVLSLADLSLDADGDGAAGRAVIAQARTGRR